MTLVRSKHQPIMDSMKDGRVVHLALMHDPNKLTEEGNLYSHPAIYKDDEWCSVPREKVLPTYVIAGCYLSE